VTFEIDTGAAFTPRTARDFVPGYVSDHWTGPEAPDADVVRCFAHHLIGSWSLDRSDDKRPRKLDTVRGQLLANWEFLRLLGKENPGLFDEVITAYVERLQGAD